MDYLFDGTPCKNIATVVFHLSLVGKICKITKLLFFFKKCIFGTHTLLSNWIVLSHFGNLDQTEISNVLTKVSVLRITVIILSAQSKKQINRKHGKKKQKRRLS